MRLKKILKKIILFFGSFFKIKNIILFESHADYSDNSRSFYEYLINNGYNKKYKIYWLVSNAKSFENRQCYNVKFVNLWHNTTQKTILQWFKYFWLAKNAKYLIFSNRTLLKVNPKSKTVSINHGVAIKKIKHRNVIPKDVDYRVESSKFCAELTMNQQGLTKKQFAIVGNPRDDVLFTETAIKEKIKDLISFDKIILWLPTFRKSAFSSRNDSDIEFPLGIPIIYSNNALIEINKYLKERNIALVLKLHPAQDVSLITKYPMSNIIIIDDKYLIDKDIELTEFYKVTDAMMTDYSSVFVDYLLTDKPLGFTTDDFEKYNNGFSMENVKNYMPGQKINNLKEFKLFIDNLYNNKDKYKKERKKVCKIFNEFNDNNSSKRLAKLLKL